MWDSISLLQTIGNIYITETNAGKGRADENVRACCGPCHHGPLKLTHILEKRKSIDFNFENQD